MVKPQVIPCSINKSYFEDTICGYIDVQNLIRGLSPSKRKIIFSLAYGYSVSEIAENMQIARSTVYRKLKQIKIEIERLQL